MVFIDHDTYISMWEIQTMLVKGAPGVTRHQPQTENTYALLEQQGRFLQASICKVSSSSQQHRDLLRKKYSKENLEIGYTYKRCATNMKNSSYLTEHDDAALPFAKKLGPKSPHVDGFPKSHLCHRKLYTLL